VSGVCALCKELICSPELQWSSVAIVATGEREQAERVQFASLVSVHMASTHGNVLEEMETAMAEAGYTVAMRYMVQAGQLQQ
jgi:hypothetical protein